MKNKKEKSVIDIAREEELRRRKFIAAKSSNSLDGVYEQILKSVEEKYPNVSKDTIRQIAKAEFEKFAKARLEELAPKDDDIEMKR